MLPPATISARFTRIAADGGRAPLDRALAAETPIAIELAGVGYAVMMATPADLEDFAIGFALAERLVDTAGEVTGIDAHATAEGIVLRVGLVPARAARVADRVRHRVSESSCGLCGIESLEQALRPLPVLPPAPPPAPAALFRALAAMRDHQPLNRATGGVHAALACAADGSVSLAREDVGRHNAFDKLIGAMARERRGWAGGFALLSSRLSFELVEKAVLAGCPTLVAVSVPSALAVSRAAAAGLRLIALARPDAVLEA